MTDASLTYKKFAGLYDVYVSKFNSDFNFYNHFCESTHNVLEVGCGTGRVSRALLEQGCNLTGVDISDKMLARASKKLKRYVDSGKLELINHDFSDSKLKNKYDIVIISFYTFNYILDSPATFLKNISASLNTGGLILLDLFYPKPMYDSSVDGKMVHKVFQTEGIMMEVYDTRIINNSIENRLQNFIVNGQNSAIESNRKYYSPHDINNLLSKSGFTSVEMACGYEFENLSEIVLECELKDNFIVKAIKS